ncbi:MAG: YbaB/EbfC family nucleoid-associated protein [Neisseriaceae bacterium]|jgi:DNA-binding YbaB/EbfC family protein
MFDKNQLANLMKKAQEMQENLQKAQQEIEQMEVEGDSGAGLVKVTMTGKKHIRKVVIDPSIIDPNDKEMLEDLIAAAVNDAANKVEKDSAEKMGGAAGNIPGMPPGFKLPF